MSKAAEEERKRMKKALLVTRVSGFIPQHEMNNVKILQEMGYEVHYAANYNTVVYGKDNHRLDGTGIIRHQVDFVRSPFSSDTRRAYRQLVELLQENEFDLLHCHMPISGVLARAAAHSVQKKTGRRMPVLYTAHGFHFHTGAPLANWVYYPVERYMARYTDRLILMNEEDCKRAQRFPIRGRVEHISGVGLNLKQFEGRTKREYGLGHRPDKEAPGSLHERFQIRQGDAVLISVGELTKGKNNMAMIQAMKELGDLPVSYVICGSGPMEQQLRDCVSELGLEERVKFAGYVTDVPDLLWQADCFVFPSRREGLPVVVMQAMAAGLPVVASRIRGVSDLIEHSKGGYLVEGHEPEDYAVKVRRLFEEKYGKTAVPREKRREQMGTWNRERVKEFSLEKVDGQMRRIYQGIQ